MAISLYATVATTGISPTYLISSQARRRNCRPEFELEDEKDYAVIYTLVITVRRLNYPGQQYIRFR